MDQPQNRLAWLFYRYWEDRCTPGEREEFLELAAEDENRTAINRLLEAVMEGPVADQELRHERADEIFNLIVKEEEWEEPFEAGRMLSWRKLAVAASVLLAIGLLVYQLVPISKPVQTAHVPTTKMTGEEIVPGYNNAILTLSDGRTIVLDSAANGTLAAEGSMKILKLNGQISYTGDRNATVPVYNTIQTAKGNQYHVVLSDGSKVWLNAASSIRFPAAFSGKERRVSITGEAYFEVAHNASAPFKVEMNGMDITVLGTRFNVNAYADEASIRTTLLEGAVKLTGSTGSGLLKPGQQASLSKEGALLIKNNVDLDEAVAWKNGVFIFNRQRLGSIMRQISRWYDVDVAYEGKESRETFSGVVSRKANLSQVLKIMEANGIRFRIEGRSITVVQ